jgi:hypothetical protein
VIAEVVLQWVFIVVGVVIAFHLGLQLSGSWKAMLAMVPVTMLMLANTPTYHYTKLFVFPLAIWLAWRYLDRPTPGRSAALGMVSSAAFFFRHDHGLWVGAASLLALVLGRVAGQASRQRRGTLIDLGAYTAAVTICLLPWVLVVQRTEGVVAYVQARGAVYQSAGNPYRRLLGLEGLRELRPVSLPPSKAGTVEFVWAPGVDLALRQKLERQHGLRGPAPQPNLQRVRYELANLYDLNLLELRRYVREESGFDWTRLNEVRYRLPSRATATLGIAQVALVIPLLLVVLGAREARRGWSRTREIPLDGLRMILAGSVLAVVDAALLRQPSYVAAVMPLTAALSARFLARRSDADRSIAGARPISQRARRLAAMTLLIVTTCAAGLASAGVSMFGRPLDESIDAAVTSVATLMASPPEGKSDAFVYLRECTGPADRLLVGGMTPFHVNYYTRRALAGGHLYWHSGWRNDPERETESLALLRRQSVPFAYSTSDPILDDFSGYPRIRAHLMQHYAELPGSNGRILFDTRKQRVRDYGEQAWPCFR